MKRVVHRVAYVVVILIWYHRIWKYMLSKQHVVKFFYCKWSDRRYLRVEGRRRRTLGAYFFCFFSLYFSCSQNDRTRSVLSVHQNGKESTDSKIHWPAKTRSCSQTWSCLLSTLPRLHRRSHPPYSNQITRHHFTNRECRQNSLRKRITKGRSAPHLFIASMSSLDNVWAVLLSTRDLLSLVSSRAWPSAPSCALPSIYTNAGHCY
jgi:hypothetical protein